MIIIFIGVYIVLAILVYLMFKILKGSVEKIGEQSKTYYIDKLGEYDELINDKENKLQLLNEEIKNKEEENKNITKKQIKNFKDVDLSIISNLTSTKYQDENIFELEKKINEEWAYNNEKIVNEFVKNIANTKNYEFCIKLRKKFKPNVIYTLKTEEPTNLENSILELLDFKEKQIFEAYKKTSIDFSIDELIEYIDELVTINNPSIKVYVGDKKENYDHVSKYIKTEYDPAIYKGVKIIYQSKLYDYSLHGKEL